MLKLYFLILLSLLSCNYVVFGSQTGENDFDSETNEIFLPMKRQKPRKVKPLLSSEASEWTSRLSPQASEWTPRLSPQASEWTPRLSPQGAKSPECSPSLLGREDLMLLGERVFSASKKNSLSLIRCLEGIEHSILVDSTRCIEGLEHLALVYCLRAQKVPCGHIRKREAYRAKARLIASLYIEAFVNGVSHGLLDQTTFKALERGCQMLKRIPTKQRNATEKFLIWYCHFVIVNMGFGISHQAALKLAFPFCAAFDRGMFLGLNNYLMGTRYVVTDETRLFWKHGSIFDS